MSLLKVALDMEIKIKSLQVTRYTTIARTIESCYNLIYLLNATLVESSNILSLEVKIGLYGLLVDMVGEMPEST